MKNIRPTLITLGLIITLVLIAFYMGKKYNVLNWKVIDKSEYESLVKNKENLTNLNKAKQYTIDSLKVENIRLNKILDSKPIDVININKEYEKISKYIRTLGVSGQLKFFTREIEKYDSSQSIVEVGLLPIN